MQKCDEKERAILLSFASRVDRNDPGALNNLAVVYFRKGMYEEAITEFKEAVKLDPKFDLARENLKYAYNISRVIDQDVQNWSARLESDPKNVEFLSNLGISYYNVGRLEEAEDTLKRAADAESSHCLARMRLGNVYKARGRYREALEHYLFVLEEMGNHPVYYTDLGEIYYNLGRSKEAIAALTTAIKIDSGYWKPHFLISFAYGDEGMLEEASKESKIASELNPYFQNAEANLSLMEEEGATLDKKGVSSGDENNRECTSYLLGVAYKERGYMKEALAEFELALIETPDNEHLHAEIAQLHLAEGQFERAAAHLLKKLESDPGNIATCKILGSEHHARGDFPEAAAYYLEAYSRDSADPDVMNNLGVLLYQTGLREDAEKMFKKGLNRSPYHVQINANVFVIYILKEDYPTAKNFLRHYEKFASETPQYHEVRALYEFKMGRVNAALEHVEKALAVDEARSDALYLKGMIHLREDNLKDAVVSITEASRLNKRFSGLDLTLSCEHRKSGQAAVVSDVSFEPGEVEIKLLQASTDHGFEEVRETIEKALEKAIEATGAVADGIAENRGEKVEEGPADQDTGGGADKKKSARSKRKKRDSDEDSDDDGFEALDKMIEELKSL
jgi:tetratricopeptide (TPR) repeat protein